MGGSVNGVKKNHKKSEKRRPETPASLPWSLKTTRHGHQIDKNSIWQEKCDGQFHKRRPKKGEKQKGYPTERFMPGNAVIMLIF